MWQCDVLQLSNRALCCSNRSPVFLGELLLQPQSMGLRVVTWPNKATDLASRVTGMIHAGPLSTSLETLSLLGKRHNFPTLDDKAGGHELGAIGTPLCPLFSST